MKMYVSPEDDAAINHRQRSIALEIASKLLEGATLKKDEAGFAAALVREWANRPEKKRDGRSKRAKFCHGTACREYAWKVGRDGMKPTHALDAVADDLDVSTPAVQQAVESNKKEVETLIETYSRM